MHQAAELGIKIGVVAFFLPLWKPVIVALAEELRAALAEERASRAWKPVGARAFRDARHESGELYGQLINAPKRTAQASGFQRPRPAGIAAGAGYGRALARPGAYAHDPEERRRRQAAARSFGRAA